LVIGLCWGVHVFVPKIAAREIHDDMRAKKQSTLNTSK
jgi:hypothetical protein